MVSLCPPESGEGRKDGRVSERIFGQLSKAGSAPVVFLTKRKEKDYGQNGVIIYRDGLKSGP